MHDEQGEYIMDKVSVVVIGLGNMGTAHATCIAKGDIQGTAKKQLLLQKSIQMSKYTQTIKFY